MKPYSAWILPALCMLISFYAKSEEATIQIKASNLNGRELSYHRTYCGVYLSTFSPIELDNDSTYTITMPVESIERMMIIANDPEMKLPGFHRSFYVLPGTTEITVDPFAEDNVAIMLPTNNKADALAARSADSVYDLWFTLATGRKDALGLFADSIPTTVTAKLDAYVDSLGKEYAGASDAVREAMVRDARLEALMVYDICLYRAQNKQNIDEWKQELNRLREKIGLAHPANARNPFFASQIADNLFYGDTYPDRKIPRDIAPDSILLLKTDYFLNTMPGKTAEAAIGTMLYNDAENGTFSPVAQDLTERFKEIFPKSGLIPSLDEKARENHAFNHPKASDDIVFLNNSDIKTLAELLAPYIGTPVLIDIWATWCGPCRKSFSHVVPIQKYADTNGIQLLYISIDEQPGIEGKWKRMARYYKLKGHHVLINPGFKQEVYSTFGDNGILSIPRFAIVDRDGNITVCPQPLSESADFSPLRDLLDNVK